MKKYNKSLFIFRRDLRLDDNTGLLEALKQSESVIPCFIFDPRQTSLSNTFKSSNALQFMIESLQDLELQLAQKKARLYLFYGVAEDIVTQLLEKEKIDAVFCNRDYTPFSIKRDSALAKICHTHGAIFESYADTLLHEPETILSLSGTPYSIFTAFFKNAVKHTVTEPKKLSSKYAASFYTKNNALEETNAVYEKILPKGNFNKKIHVHGGRKNGLSLLKKITEQKEYAQTHDYPTKHTSDLSAHHKFGAISIRESYHTIKKTFASNHPLIRQLFWRDFFTHVAYHSPFVFGQPYHEKYKNLPWQNDKRMFDAWCWGKTGFPIIDAGMRQLNQTGFLHNRVRMIVASFLTKDLHIDWLWGEKYFAQKLVDYDPAVNNGNWQWAASTGCDAQPYFRIFNPWLQQKKFDPQCIYIKKWLPELKDVAPNILHRRSDLKQKATGALEKYPLPIIDHTLESKKAKLMYKNCSL
ncbi:deoxyribodipyrimidine photolyase [Candidatus Dependentiae bacterium HGW-Dependentiae-1]|nr:MAG: deoxyribodipyrimidine photolyase [Candidatus Dependentiae bacterium HGW-Dependentiae-1]